MIIRSRRDLLEAAGRLAAAMEGQRPTPSPHDTGPASPHWDRQKPPVAGDRQKARALKRQQKEAQA